MTQRAGLAALADGEGGERLGAGGLDVLAQRLLGRVDVLT